MGRSLSEISNNDPRLLEPLELFATCKVNCLQAVLMPFVKNESPQTNGILMGMTRDLGGGIAGMGYVCGALIGALMVLSRKLEEERFSTSESELFIREFSQQFGKSHGTLFCSGIKAQAGKEEEYEACQYLVVDTINAMDRALDQLSDDKTLRDE